MRTLLPRRMFNARRWLLFGAIAVVAFAIALVAFLRVQFHGEALARTVQSVLNNTMRGRIEVKSIEWAMSDLPKVIGGGWVEVTVHDLKVWDDGGSKHEIDEDNRQLVLAVEKLTGKLDAHALLFGHHDVVLTDVKVTGKSYALIKQVPEPYPLHEYDYTVASIISAFYPRVAPGFRAGLTAESMPIVDVRSLAIDGGTVEFVFPAFHLLAYDVSTQGFFYSDFSDPLSEKMYFSLLDPRAGYGVLRLGDIEDQRGTAEVADREIATVYEIPLQNIRLSRFRQLPLSWPRDVVAHDVEFDITARTTSGAAIAVTGGMYDYWLGYYGGDYDIAVEVTEAGELARALTEGMASGDALALSARVTGSTLAPKVSMEIEGLDLAIPIGKGDALDLSVPRAQVALDLATDEGTVDDTVARGAGGEVRLNATFAVDPFRLDLDVDISRAIELAPYIPADVRKLAGSKLTGRFHVGGTEDTQHLDELDVQLGRMALTGSAFRDARGMIHTDELQARLGQTTVTMRGRVDTVEERLAMWLTVRARDLPRWLAVFDVPPLAGGVDGTAEIRGAFANPIAEAQGLVFTGVPVVQRVEADIRYGDGEVVVRDASSSSLGGSIHAHGTLRLGPRPELVSAGVTAAQVDLSRLPLPSGVLAGRADARLTARGRLDRLQADLSTELFDLAIAGDDYRDVVLAASLDRSGAGSLVLELPRTDGARLAVNVARAADDALTGEVRLDALALDNVSALDALGEPGRKLLGGVVSTVLALSGTSRAPTASGDIRWSGAWVGSAYLGPARWRLWPAGDGRIAFEGALLQGALTMRGTVDTRAPFDLAVTMRAHRVELDRFAPESVQDTMRSLGIRAWVSGELAVALSLLPGSSRKPEITAVLSEVVATIDNEDAEGRPAPVRIANSPATPVTIHYDGVTASLTSPVSITGPSGDAFALSGTVRPDALDLHLAGDVTMDVFEPYLRDYFDEMSGMVKVTLRATGSMDDPQVALGVEVVEEVSVRPIGQDAVVSVAANGRIDVSSSYIAPTNLQVRTVDQASGETAVLDIRGTVGMIDFVPASWGLFVDGELAGKTLLVVAPRLFSQASGRAALSVALQTIGEAGDGTAIKWPQINGSIEFTPEQDPVTGGIQPLSITPRGLRRELVFTGGEVRFSTDLIELDRITGTIDQEGEITDLTAEISIDDWQPTSADVALSANSLPFRIPQELDLTLNVDRLQIVGHDLTAASGGLDVTGTIEVVDGRYIRDFNIIKEVLRPAERSTEISTPFYEEIPLLANAELDLELATRAFFVQNNIASVQLVGGIGITGTPRAPRIDGEIRVEQGEFKIPGLRAKFGRTEGTVTFSRFLLFPEETPTLDIRSESNYRDPSGQDHLVTLIVSGRLDELNWDLFTTSGLNKGQTLTLLVSGRTPEEVRASLGDQAPGREPGRLARSTDPSEGYADELLKAIAGDFISLILEDKLRNLTTLDVARLEIGTGSIGFHGEKELFKNLTLLGDLEQTLRGRTYDVTGKLKLSDRLSLEGEYLNKDFADDAEEDKTDTRLRIVYRFLIP